jgi:hypothetical protein
MDHDHNKATHTFKCPVEGCEHTVEVHAHNDDEAVQLIMQSGKAHFDEAHPDIQGMDPKEMETTTRARMVSK